MNLSLSAPSHLPTIHSIDKINAVHKSNESVAFTRASAETMSLSPSVIDYIILRREEQ